MRLIDIEAPCKIEIELYGEKCHATVTAPTVDAVPVVRCRDCKYYYKDAEDGYGMCDNSEGKDHVTEDGFCYWGKRKVEK